MRAVTDFVHYTQNYYGKFGWQSPEPYVIMDKESNIVTNIHAGGIVWYKNATVWDCSD